MRLPLVVLLLLFELQARMELFWISKAFFFFSPRLQVFLSLFLNLTLDLNVSTDLSYIVFGQSQKQIVLKNIMRTPLLLRFLAQRSQLQSFGWFR